jgi:lysophospholipase L1-like esterase
MTLKGQVVCLLLVSFCSAATEEGVYIRIDDPNWYFSDYNWFESTATSKATANPGARFKLSFANSSYVNIWLNTSRIRGSAPTTAQPTMKLAYSIDDEPWRFTLLGPGNGSSANPIVDLMLVAPLPAKPQHDVVVVIFASFQMYDRWLGGFGDPRGSSYLEVAGANLDVGGVTMPPSTLRPKKMLFYGDSITEGTNAHYFDYYANQCHFRGGELVVNAAPASWGAVLAEALDAEPSQTAFAGTGYVTRNSYIYGNVPPLLCPGNATGSAWDKIDAEHSRLPYLKSSPPDYVFSAHGNNDMFCGVKSPKPFPGNNCTYTELQASVTAWLGAVREATSPATRIVLIVPFGGDFHGNTHIRTSIRAAYTAYQMQAALGAAVGDISHTSAVDASATSLGDNATFMVDLYPQAQHGIGGGSTSGPSQESCDGTHPLANTHARLAAMIAVDLTKQECARGLA